MSTTAQRAAAARYKKKLGRIDLRPPVELLAQIRAHALATGESVQGFILRAAREAMARDDDKKNSRCF